MLVNSLKSVRKSLTIFSCASVSLDAAPTVFLRRRMKFYSITVRFTSVVLRRGLASACVNLNVGSRSRLARPKLYARIARFEAALDSKARARAKSWTDVAYEFGYHDQMHLVHDFEQFSGQTPTNLLREVERAHRAGPH